MTVLIAALLTSALPACVPVETEQITGADLAKADAAFAELVQGVVIGYSPAPGHQRTFGIAELRGIAATHGIAAEPSRELCFEWPVSPLDARHASDVMQTSYPTGRIDIVELSRYPVPRGELRFPASGLALNDNGPSMWRGFIEYGKGRKFAVWARVDLRITKPVVVAVELLPAGKPIVADQLRIEEYDGPPLRTAAASEIDEVAGRVPRTAIAAGAKIVPSSLEAAKDIVKGETVTVEVRSGAARIELQAKAVISAAAGQSVQLRNETTGKSFRATASGKGRAIVTVGGTE